MKDTNAHSKNAHQAIRLMMKHPKEYRVILETNESYIDSYFGKTEYAYYMIDRCYCDEDMTLVEDGKVLVSYNNDGKQTYNSTFASIHNAIAFVMRMIHHGKVRNITYDCY